MIETSRLKTYLLTYEQVLKYKDKKSELETDLGLVQSSWEHTEDVKEMLEERLIPRLVKNKTQLIFNSIWLAIDKRKNVIVADFGIKGNPVSNISNDGINEIEIGYGTMPQFQGNGYMTEAVGGFVKWAFERSDIDLILANTDKNNFASIKVLEKNEFEKFNENENEFCWRKNVACKLI
jgi:ribosomal-protein-alanine N-acetyltransferase